VREMGQAYPELRRAEALITETLKLEEIRFRKTLERGLSLLDEEARALVPGTALKGETAFRLYDTYGFPLDLTQDALRARGIAVETDGFHAAMAKQKADARAAWSGSGEAATETLWFGVKDRVGATEFLGYETEGAEGVVTALVRDGREVETLSAGETGFVVLNQTPFYGESGGQVGDSGRFSGEGVSVTVLDTQKKLGDVFVHAARVEQGALKVGQALALEVEHGRRGAIRSNHSATHLLHEALRHVLGDHVAQKGSLVNAERLRFDISHPKPITHEELSSVETLANRMVVQNTPVVTRLMGVDEAIESGARALFGEKYGEEVRVVSMGRYEDGPQGGKPYSVELCGGTHVRRTGDIGLISIVDEGAVSAGVRRIEALTGQVARENLNQEGQRLQAVASALRVSPNDAVDRVEQLVEEKRRLERELAEARKKLAMGGGAQGGDEVADVGDVRFLARVLPGIEARDLKGIADEGKARVGSGVVALVGVSEDGKAGLVIAVTDDLTKRFNAVDLVRKGAEVLGGKGGGGRPDMAQAGGPNGAAAEAALAAIRQVLVAG